MPTDAFSPVFAVHSVAWMACFPDPSPTHQEHAKQGLARAVNVLADHQGKRSFASLRRVVAKELLELANFLQKHIHLSAPMEVGTFVVGLTALLGVFMANALPRPMLLAGPSYVPH